MPINQFKLLLPINTPRNYGRRILKALLVELPHGVMPLSQFKAEAMGGGGGLLLLEK